MRQGKTKSDDSFIFNIDSFGYLAMRPAFLPSTLLSAGVGEGLSPTASLRSSLSSLWLRSDEKLRLEGVARCSVLL